MPEGLYHLVCEIIVEHRDSSILAMQRYPLISQTTRGVGDDRRRFCPEGEDPLTCARRELYEETGLRVESLLELLGREVSDPAHSIFYMYRADVDCVKNSISLQAGETMGHRWIPPGEFPAFVQQDMIPSQRRRYGSFSETAGISIKRDALRVVCSASLVRSEQKSVFCFIVLFGLGSTPSS